MRLIDADKLIDALHLWGCYKYKNPKAYDTMMLYEILQAIEDQPTAFDVDKVVEELKNMQEHHKVLADYERQVGTIVEMREHEYAIKVLSNVIDIVKRGGGE